MKATGIVRRIDDLGRVVIPKEIRRTMRIGTGAQLEIFTDDQGGVIFKKYSPMAELAAIAQGYAQALGRAIKLPAAICDRERIVAVSSGSRRELIGAYIGEGAQDALSTRKTEDFHAARPIGDTEYQIRALYPVIAQSEVMGGVLLLGTGPLMQNTSETELALMRLTAGLLALNFED